VDDPLTEDQIKAIQIAHNALVGEDDPFVLKEIYESIGAGEIKEYSGIDNKLLGLLEKVSVDTLASGQLEWTTVSFLFLPDEVERLRASLAAEGKSAKLGFAARVADYDRFMEALALAADSFGVSNAAAALASVLDVFDAHLDDLDKGFLDSKGEPARKGNVPAAAALKAQQVPAVTASLLARILEKSRDRKSVV
jgi:hypothetical protein